MRKTAYVVETGWLMNEDDKEYELYARVYDKQHGFYDDWTGYFPSLEEAIEFSKNSVEEDGERAYAIVSEKLAPKSDMTDEELKAYPVEGMERLLENVVFSCANRDGAIQENFLGK